MAYTEKNPTLYAGNLLHYGSCTGSVALNVPCGVSKFIVHAVSNNLNFAVNCGTKTNYSSQNTFRTESVITLASWYGVVANKIYLTLSTTSAITIEILEIEGAPSDDYYTLINKRLFDTTPEEVVATAEITEYSVGDTTNVSVPEKYLSYFWERSRNNGETWQGLGGAGANATLSYTVTSNDNNALFRCRVVDAFENTIYSNSVKITVLED